MDGFAELGFCSTAVDICCEIGESLLLKIERSVSSFNVIGENDFLILCGCQGDDVGRAFIGVDQLCAPTAVIVGLMGHRKADEVGDLNFLNEFR